MRSHPQPCPPPATRTRHRPKTPQNRSRQPPHPCAHRLRHRQMRRRPCRRGGVAGRSLLAGRGLVSSRGTGDCTACRIGRAVGCSSRFPACCRGAFLSRSARSGHGGLCGIFCRSCRKRGSPQRRGRGVEHQRRRQQGNERPAHPQAQAGRDVRAPTRADAPSSSPIFRYVALAPFELEHARSFLSRVVRCARMRQRPDGRRSDLSSFARARCPICSAPTADVRVTVTGIAGDLHPDSPGRCRSATSPARLRATIATI